MGSDLLMLHSDHMTAEQLFISHRLHRDAQIISLSSAAVVCAATQFLTLFATKRTTAQNGVAFRDEDNLQMSVIQKNTDASNGRSGGYINVMSTAENTHTGKKKKRKTI